MRAAGRSGAHSRSNPGVVPVLAGAWRGDVRESVHRGTAVVVGTGIYTFHREERARRGAAKLLAPAGRLE